eukprot:gene3575-6182_t
MLASPCENFQQASVMYGRSIGGQQNETHFSTRRSPSRSVRTFRHSIPRVWAQDTFYPTIQLDCIPTPQSPFNYQIRDSSAKFLPHFSSDFSGDFCPNCTQPQQERFYILHVTV